MSADVLENPADPVAADLILPVLLIGKDSVIGLRKQGKKQRIQHGCAVKRIPWLLPEVGTRNLLHLPGQVRAQGGGFICLEKWILEFQLLDLRTAGHEKGRRNLK